MTRAPVFLFLAVGGVIPLAYSSSWLFSSFFFFLHCSGSSPPPPSLARQRTRLAAAAPSPLHPLPPPPKQKLVAVAVIGARETLGLGFRAAAVAFMGVGHAQLRRGRRRSTEKTWGSARGYVVAIQRASTWGLGLRGGQGSRCDVGRAWARWLGPVVA